MNYQLYKKNSAQALSRELFENPTSEYRGTPFWAWNAKLDKQTMKEQMDVFCRMGFGGFHMHSRTGLDVPYLSDEFMGDVKYCVEYAAEHDMLAWAYDEDRFPSGFAGGLVTKDKKYRYRELVWIPKEIESIQGTRPETRAEESYRIGIYDIVLDEEGCLKEYGRIADAGQAKGDVWYAYLRVADGESWFNNQTYVDTLDTASIERFCEVTHERYKEVVGEYFGSVIPSFFTDEPKTTYKKTLANAKARKKLIMPWTDDFPDTFAENYQMNIEERLPELFWELPDGKISQARYFYHRHVLERFAESYSGTISRWCEANGVKLAGHMVKEPSLATQSTSAGESMAPLAPFGFPGIDMLCNEREYTTAKQAQSVKHQLGREAMLSEIYGVTNWDFDFRGHKTAGDWQAALGVTIRVPHLSWMTMEGEAKRDYPAPIGYQSPWHEEYSLIENHFARLNTAMTRGRAVIRIGVIHPVESYWCCWGPEAQTADRKTELNEAFLDLTEWLIYSQLDFDFISESMLAKMTENAGGLSCESSIMCAEQTDDEAGAKFHVGESAYDVVLVPVCLTLRSTTVDALEAFVRAGGKVIFTGEVPKLEEGAPSGRLAAFASFEMSQEELHTEEGNRGEIVNIPFSRTAILEALEPYRELKVLDKSGKICTKIISQLRQDGDDQWLFACYARKKPRYDCELTSWMKICKKGIWYPTEYDTMTGEIKPCEYVHENGMTCIMKTYHIHDSVLLMLAKNPEAEIQAGIEADGAATDSSSISAAVSADVNSEKSEAERPLSNTASVVTNLNRMTYTLSEPNVAVLDRARYRLDDEVYRPEEEVLRIGQQLCAECGYPPQGGKIAQPWTKEKRPAPHKVTLAFTFESEITVKAPLLALEQADASEITLNGKPVKAAEADLSDGVQDSCLKTIETATGGNGEVTMERMPVTATASRGWYVDKSIHTVSLPEIPAGSNTICITYPFGEGTSLENAFLLGDFGVRVEGSGWVLTKQPETVAFGSLVSQGFPFYGGNISYEMELDMPEGDFAIRTSYYRGALIGVSVDGKREGSIVFSPYRFEKKGLTPGHHKVTLTLFGTRINTFGTLHNCNENETWFGPDAWRTKGDYYSEEYQLKKTGILKRPEIY